MALEAGLTLLNYSKKATTLRRHVTQGHGRYLSLGQHRHRLHTPANVRFAVQKP